MCEQKIVKKNVFITGVSGYIGQRIVERFSSREDIGEIIGIDIVDPPCYREKMTFIKHDVRNDLTPLMSGYHIDWAIHGAFVVSYMKDTNLPDEIDIQGTNNFHKACEQLKIRNVMHISSTTAYGGHEDNPELLTEELPLKGNDDFPYGKNKAIIENSIIKTFMGKNPGVNYTVVRPCFVCGPHFYKNLLGRHLMKKIVILPRDAKPFQFVHEDDVADSIHFLLSNNMKGVFNLAADGIMTFREMAALTGGIYLPIAPSILAPVSDLAWKMNMSFIAEFPSSPMPLIRFPWLASNRKIKNAGYRFRYTTKETYETFAEQVRNFYGRDKK